VNRFGAFAAHLGISLIVFLILGYIILFHWYPDFFFASDGGWQGIRIIAAVDLVLGPMLTLVVYKQGKPRLRFDLTCIGLFQAVCLAAGVWVVYSERPVAMIYADGLFTTQSADDYHKAGQEVPDLESFRRSAGPAWVSIVLPEDMDEQSNIRRSAMERQVSLRSLPELYEPFDTLHVDEGEHGFDYAAMRASDEEAPFLNDFLEANGGALEDYVFLRFGTRYRLDMLAMRKADHALIYLPVPNNTPA
jgi:hypothetical protein